MYNWVEQGSRALGTGEKRENVPISNLESLEYITIQERVELQSGSLDSLLTPLDTLTFYFLADIALRRLNVEVGK